MKNNPLIPTLVLAGATSLAAMLTPVAAKAVSVTYNVNRSWSQSGNNASLVGTVAVPLGNYTITDGGSTPFTNVNLTLKLNGTPYTLDTVYNVTNADGKFYVNAGPSALIFNTADAVAPNVAGLSFVNLDGDYYDIKTYDSSIEQAGDSSGRSQVTASVSFPLTFGTAQQVPEPLTMLGAGVVLGAIPVLKKEYAKRNKKKNGDA